VFGVILIVCVEGAAMVQCFSNEPGFDSGCHLYELLLWVIWSNCSRATQKASLFTWSDPLNVECRTLKGTGSIVKVTVLTGTVMYVYYIFQPPVSSGATLIVAPHSITHQWVDEVLRHVAVDALQIFVSSLYLLNLLMARYDHCNCHVM